MNDELVAMVPIQSSSKRAQADDLAEVIAVCAARIDSALHQLLTHIRRFDEIRGWSWQNTISCAHWLSWRIGLGMVAAREKVRVANALGRLPLIDASLSRGELSYAKVRAVTRVATRDNEDLLLAQAQGSTGAELERICAGFRKLLPGAIADEERRTVRRRSLDDGLVQIELRLLPDEAARVWQAIGEVRRELTERASAESPKEARPSRTVSTPLLRALKMRDRKCRFPGCSSAAFVDAHHIEHWAQGGETKIDNLVLVCSRHHVALHEGGFGVERTEAGGLVFRDPDGRVIEPAPRSAFLGDATASLEEEQKTAGIDIDARTGRVRRSFLPPDWDGCVRALVQRAERARLETDSHR